LYESAGSESGSSWRPAATEARPTGEVSSSGDRPEYVVEVIGERA
jgi:hypothetical protein